MGKKTHSLNGRKSRPSSHDPPFEKELFAHTSLPIAYVGNPLVEKINAYAYKPLEIRTDKKIVALFPGSRKKEIERNLPLQLQVCKNLSDFHLAISLSDERFAPLIESTMRQEGFILGNEISIIPGDYSYELMRASHFAIAKSGTVTLELRFTARPVS